MTATNEPQDPRQPAGAGSPGDIPAGRPAALSRLDALLGEWEMEVSFEAGYFGPGSPPGRGPRRPDQVHVAGREFS
jgi:hypothetical protein